MTAEDLLPVDDEDLDAVAEELAKEPSEAEEEDTGEIAGLVIADNTTIRMYDFGERDHEVVGTNLPGMAQSLAYHDKNLWIVHTGGCIGTPKEHTKSYSRDGGAVFCLFTHEGTLYAAGTRGISEAMSRKNHISSRDIANRGISSIHHVFQHKTGDENMLVALVGMNNTRWLYTLEKENGKLVIDKCLGKHPAEGEKIGDAISVKGGVVSTITPGYLDKWGAPEPSTALKKSGSDEALYLCLAYDSAREVVYASGLNVHCVKRFRMDLTRNGAYSFMPMPDIAAGGLSDMVEALLPVTANQMENIRRNSQYG
jgi:hypothetical protein